MTRPGRVPAEMLEDLRHRWRRLRAQGVRRGVGLALSVRAESLLYERRFGLDTDGVVHQDDHADHVFYEPVRWRIMPMALPPHEVSADDVLLDVGCGKGRAVFIAARRYPVRRVVGVDVAPQLVEAARRNVERSRRHLRCPRIELLVADARTWAIPDDVTVITLYNPFRGKVLEAFLARVGESLERRPRRLRLLYINAMEPEAFERARDFSLRRVTPTGIHGPGALLYEALPA